MKVLLTYNEAAILGAFGEASEALIPELAVSAKLTPTEMKDAIKGLQNKELVSLFGNDKFVRLTLKGEQARLNWAFDPAEFCSGSLYSPKGGGKIGAVNIDEALQHEIDKLKP